MHVHNISADWRSYTLDEIILYFFCTCVDVFHFESLICLYKRKKITVFFTKWRLDYLGLKFFVIFTYCSQTSVFILLYVYTYFSLDIWSRDFIYQFHAFFLITKSLYQQRSWDFCHLSNNTYFFNRGIYYPFISVYLNHF